MPLLATDDHQDRRRPLYQSCHPVRQGRTARAGTCKLPATTSRQQHLSKEIHVASTLPHLNESYCPRIFTTRRSSMHKSLHSIHKKTRGPCGSRVNPILRGVMNWRGGSAQDKPASPTPLSFLHPVTSVTDLCRDTPAYYFPIQKREKITPSKSSGVNLPVMLLSRSCASLSSSANKSRA